MKKALITGASGRLGQALLAAQRRADRIELLTPNRNQLELTNIPMVREYLDHHHPDVIVHLAAYSQVDAAQEDRERAFAVNAHSTEHLARWAGEHDAQLLYISTDYVFDGVRDGDVQGAYLPNDTTHPINVYGESKLAGEQAIQTHCQKHWILRSSWLHHEVHAVGCCQTGPACFTHAIVKRLLADQQLQVVNDQIGTPTTYLELSQAIWDVMATDGNKTPYGTYHCAGEDVMSWHELAQRIANKAQRLGLVQQAVEVAACDSSTWGKGRASYAPRPKYSALKNTL